MKNALFLLLLFAFIGCSKDDKKEDESKLKYIQIKMKYDTDGVGPSGEVFVFFLKGKHPKENAKPRFFDYKDESMCAIMDVNGEYIYHTYKTKFKAFKDENTGKYKNESSVVLNMEGGINGLSFPDGESQEGNYLIVIDLSNESYRYTYKYLTINESVVLEKTFQRNPEDSESYEEWL